MKEDIWIQEEKTVFENVIFRHNNDRNNVQSPRSTASRNKAVIKEAAILVRYGPTVIILNLEEFSKYLYIGKRGLPTRHTISGCLNDNIIQTTRYYHLDNQKLYGELEGLFYYLIYDW